MEQKANRHNRLRERKPILEELCTDKRKRAIIKEKCRTIEANALKLAVDDFAGICAALVLIEKELVVMLQEKKMQSVIEGLAAYYGDYNKKAKQDTK